MTEEKMVKVVFQLEGDTAERLWAREIGINAFEIMNTPFYVYGVSNGDIVEALQSSVQGLFTFVRILKKSGWKTVRVLIGDYLPNGSGLEVLTQLLETMNCTGYESGFETILAVDVPPLVDIVSLGEVLDREGYTFEYGDPSYAELFPN
jgi:hypothetical protein